MSWLYFLFGVCRGWKPLEADLHGFPRGSFLQLKKLSLLEAKEARDDIAGEGLYSSVEVAHHCVVKAARLLDLVFGIGELALELEEVGVGFEVGICLGHGKQ